jgi:hypothetical protein
MLSKFANANPTKWTKKARQNWTNPRNKRYATRKSLLPIVKPNTVYVDRKNTVRG